MNKLCGESKLWDSKLTWDTNTPDFTECFKKSVLVLMPCIFLWIFIPIEVILLRRSETRDIPFNYLNISKLIFIFIGASLAFVDFLYHVSLYSFQAIVDLYYSPIILCLTFILFIILTVANIKRGIRSSGILFTFSFLCVICGIPKLYRIIKTDFPTFIFSLPPYNFQNENDVENLLYILYYTTIVVVFLLNCFADERPQKSLYSTPKNTYPFKEASFLSKLFMTWFDPYVWKNYKKAVRYNLWNLDSKDMAENNASREEFHQKKKRKKNKTRTEKFSIVDALSKENGYLFWFCTLLRTISEVMSVGLYIVTDWLISSLQLKEETWKEYLYVGSYFTIIMCQTFVSNKYSEQCYRLDFRVKSSAMSYLYKKALLISTAVRTEYSTSDILNLISVDTFQLQNSIKEFHFLIALCVQILTSYIYLWFLLGLNATISAAFIIFIFILNYRSIVKIKHLQQEEMEKKDERGKFMQEIFTGIKVLKMYAWEIGFKKKAMSLRREENKTLRKIVNVNSTSQIGFQNSSFWTTLVAFLCYELVTSKVMDVRIAYVSIVVFNAFRVPFHQIPQTTLSLQQVLISIKRMNKFLNSEESDETSISHEPSNDERLFMRKASFSWTGKEGPALLHDVNIKIKDCSLIAVAGPVGAGKSSLISAFLGEMYKISGHVNTRGTIAYVPQQAWILNASIKENITLGEHVDKELYEKALESCALKPDLETFPGGDLTEIGERGINLSGGQKQRISLARAVCRSADIYFLDDPLSAVDTHVANHIFHNVLGPNGILKGKVRLLVTHNARFFPLMDEIIVLKNGRVSEVGTYQKLMDQGGQFAEYSQSIRDHIQEKKLEENALNICLDNRLSSDENRSDDVNEYSQNSFENRPKLTHKIICEEDVKVKRINKNTYWIYIKAGGIYSWLLVLTSLAFFQISLIMSNACWLSKWVGSVDDYRNKYFYVSVYAGFGLMQIALATIGAVLLYRSSANAASYFYQELLDCVMEWPMSIFDTTPIGRIIKRFSDDTFMLDNHLGMKWAHFFAVFYRYLSIVIFTSFVIPASIVTTIPLVIVFYTFRKYYVSLHHQLKRIETKVRSPLYSHLVETVSGIQSIRAFNLQNKFIQKCYKKIDVCSAAYHASITCERWFCSRVEFIECLFLCSTSIFVIQARNHLDIDILSVTIVFGLQVIRGIAYMSAVISGIEDGIISLEEINEYLAYPREPFSQKSLIQVSQTWPNKGEIIFDNLKLRYREGLDFVLDGLSFAIKSNEKIGIVGRTGAGKSSIIAALFRLVEAAEGNILIDNVDITEVNLRYLRSKIAIIPQDPVLFSGTLRFNLDPFDDYQDDHLWNILEKSHLKTFVSNLPGGLHYSIMEGGQNLSFGQRQLICLARALLRKSKILVLDEATASVDLVTDNLIQNTIQKEFFDCTVITIAHRLNTLRGYDKILVLERGRIVKFDTPENVIHLGE